MSQTVLLRKRYHGLFVAITITDSNGGLVWLWDGKDRISLTEVFPAGRLLEVLQKYIGD